MSTLFLRRKANQQKANNPTPLQQFAEEEPEAVEEDSEIEPEEPEFDMSAF